MTVLEVALAGRALAETSGRRVLPSPDVVTAASALVAHLVAHDLVPDRVAPDHEGGLTLYWFCLGGYTLVAVDNDGSVVVGSVRR